MQNHSSVITQDERWLHKALVQADHAAVSE